MSSQPLRRQDSSASIASQEALAAAGSEAEFREPLEQLLQAVVTLAGAAAAAIRHLEEDTHQLRLVAAVGMPVALWDATFEVADSCGTCGEAVARNRPRLATQPCGCAIDIGKTFPAADRYHTYAVPLHHRGAACGVLKLFLPPGRKPPASLAPLLVALGAILGLTLENGRLMRQNLHAGLAHERQMLASEVHDSLAQNLASMRMRMPLLRDAIAAHDDARTARYLEEFDESLVVSHRRVRALITHFRTELDPRGLVHALTEAVAGFRAVSAIDFSFDNRVAHLELTDEQQLQVFHVVSEALANVMKHARARHCRLTIDEHDGHYAITVADDGVGLAADYATATEHGHFGLNIMRERVAQLGGHIDFESEAGAGTRVRLRFPATTSEGRHHHE
ncbi:MAG TPA: ATP-binding protein [Rhodocyclaceae bacterium]|nr:ATP-binding protein [Rhodocyclaceae bacterium]